MKTANLKLATCPECAGRGYTQDPFGSDEPVACPACNGRDPEPPAAAEDVERYAMADLADTDEQLDMAA